MARGRMISKTLGTSSKKFARLRTVAADVGQFAQTLYMLLVVNADDFGRLQGDGWTVKHSVWPTAPEDEDSFARAIAAMHDVGLLVKYEVDGNVYLQVVKFDPHQQGIHKRTASKFPNPQED